MRSLHGFLGAAALCALALPAAADQVIADDLIVDGSICAGQDCVNGESFGFDTLRLKENNLRIKAQDTSNSASFPTVDWQITFNDSSNGGANKFSIDEIDGGATPFTIEAGTRSNQLYLDSSDRVGFGTATPVVDLHVRQGNTPTLRLEQDGSSGFTAQTWDIAGNEAGFFVRDVTNGSNLAFRIRPGAPASAIDIAADGDVGIGTASPDAQLDVTGSTGHVGLFTANGGNNTTATLLVEDVSATPAVRELLRVRNNGGGFIAMENTAVEDTWFLIHENNAPNRFLISHTSLGTTEMALDENGNMTIGGTLTQNSDRTNKTGIEAVDRAALLAKVAALPISEWSYRHDAAAGIRHIGPMAQDFHAAFGTGDTDRGISSIDTSGVALAAIQALHAENAALKARLAALEARLPE